MKGLDKDERNIILLVKTKGDSSEARAVTLTDYIGKGLLGSTPKIVKISDSKFAVLWQEFTYDGKDKGLRFVMVDDAGNRVGDIQTADAVLSRDCAPVLNGEDLVWYVNEGEGSRRFYKVSISASADVNAQDNFITYADKTVNIKVGETITPSLSHSTGGVEFSSSDTAVATVSGQGAISGVAPGTATVTAALSGTQLKSTVTVNVTSASSSGNQTNQPDTADTSSTLYMIISAIISIINFIIRFISSLSAA
ncbi:MAG: Ig-like domain-containing protein [Clostridia bacterium]|nr:Ig-like domain-containing protein [Clostridia bacterium]